MITEKDSLGKKFNLKILGNHNQKNANMVFLLGKALGIPEDKIIKSIEGFTGIEEEWNLLPTRVALKFMTIMPTTPQQLQQLFKV